jgi:hypothetical protein
MTGQHGELCYRCIWKQDFSNCPTKAQRQQRKTCKLSCVKIIFRLNHKGHKGFSQRTHNNLVNFVINLVFFVVKLLFIKTLQ